MNVYKSIEELPSGVDFGLTIGNFDGLHLGHQYLLNKIIDRCEVHKFEPLVLTFNPHPMSVLFGKKHFLISDYLEKKERLQKNGIINILEIGFDRNLSQKSPGDFLDQYILKNNSIKGMFLGHDFAFGANKEGNHDFVMKYCKNKPIVIETLDRLLDERYTFSSSQIRKFLACGDMSSVSRILGRSFEINGLVEKGDGRGRGLGFATANTRVTSEKIIPQNGVYYTKTVINGNTFKSLTNIGSNPTFNGHDDRKLIETHIIDFDENIYGSKIKVLFLEKCREEKKFESVTSLVEQIEKDVDSRIKYGD